MSFNTRELSTVQKVEPAGSRNSKYKPMVLCDESVFNMAQHYYTAEEIAERFSISRVTLMAHHGDAFRAGKDDARNLPRMMLRRVLNDFSSLEDGVFTRQDMPTNTLLKAIELNARMHEGLGQTQTVITKEEKPSASDIRFVPLQAPE